MNPRRLACAALALVAVPVAGAEFRAMDRLSAVGPAVFGATMSVSAGVTASSGTFTATGPAQFSLETASGVKVNTGGVIAQAFAGNGAALTGVATGPDTTKVLASGDTMSGALTLSGTPTAASHAATKGYVDSWTKSCVNPADAADIMVAVGDLCADKYEASVWSTQTGGAQYGAAADNYPCLDSGQDCAAGAANPIYARSVSGVTPSRYLTWFQARIACANAGKHLLTNAEWQVSAAGTPDPGAGVAFPGCNVNTHATSPSTTGGNTSCLSGYGAENMVGSLWEWTADWGQFGQHYSGAPTNWTDGTKSTAHWPDASYGADASWNLAGRAWDGAAWKQGMPGVPERGGAWTSGTNAGVFAYAAGNGPTQSDNRVGFRCGRRRQ